MAKKVQWVDGHIVTAPPKKPKKITGTHFPEVLRVHPYTTPFEAWCRCTRTYEKPFEGNEYTRAGETIEPKVFDFLEKTLGAKYRVVRPSDIYGEDVFSKTWGDFFPMHTVFGGSWDALIVDRDTSELQYIVEVKTVLCDGHSGGFSKRWKGGHAPDYQALQASLYAHLFGIENVLMVGVELMKGRGDYDDPDSVTPDYGNGNVHLDEFKVHERYPDFDSYIDYAERWWNRYVLTGESPDYDAKKDADILKALKTDTLAPDTDINALLDEAIALKEEIDAAEAGLSEKYKRQKVVSGLIKEYLEKKLGDGTDTVQLKRNGWQWVCDRSLKEDIDKDAMKRDGIFDRYKTTKASSTMRMTKEK